MSKENKKQTSEKNRPVAKLSYLAYGAKGYGTAIGPVFATSRPDCKSVVVDSIPLDLIRDLQRGTVGSFFIWDRKEENGSGA